MAKIVTVYERLLREHDKQRRDLVPSDMSYIRWYKISEALARLGYRVDMAIPDSLDGWQNKSLSPAGPNIRRIPLSEVKWDDYDVVKTLFHRGFDTLETYGGSAHPFIISKLGSVVGPEDMDGVYFYGKIREELYSIQKKINQASKYVTVLSSSAKELWHVFRSEAQYSNSPRRCRPLCSATRTRPVPKAWADKMHFCRKRLYQRLST